MLRTQPRLQTSYPHSAYLLTHLYAPSPPSSVSGCSAIPPASSTHSLRVIQWKFKIFDPEALDFISIHPLDVICIQESNLDSFLFFRIPENSLQSDRTHYRSGISSLNNPLANCDVIIFVRHKISFSKLSNSSHFTLTRTVAK